MTKILKIVELSHCRVKSFLLTKNSKKKSRGLRPRTPNVAELSDVFLPKNPNVELSHCRVKSFFKTFENKPNVELSHCRVKSLITVPLGEPQTTTFSKEYPVRSFTCIIPSVNHTFQRYSRTYGTSERSRKSVLIIRTWLKLSQIIQAKIPQPCYPVFFRFHLVTTFDAWWQFVSCFGFSRRESAAGAKFRCF